MDTKLKISLLKVTAENFFPLDLIRSYHTHLICHSGKISFSFNQLPMECRSGQFLFWFAESNLSGVSFSKTFRATVLLVEKDFLNQNIPDQGWSINALLHSRVHPVKQPNATDLLKIGNNFKWLHDHSLDSQHRFYNEVLEHQMKIFIFEMWNIFANEYENRRHTLQTGTLYERFMGLVQEHSLENRQVQYFAEKLNITPKYLNEVCREHSGVTASGWIQRFAREHLMLLLQNKNLNVSEIADRMNFSSRSFFTRYVRKLLGMTPKEYRERLG